MIAAESTELFVGPRTAPLQVVRVQVSGQDGAAHVHVEGPGLHCPKHGEDALPGLFGFEVGVDVSEHQPGDVVPARAIVRAGGELSCEFDLVVAEPGWTMHMVTHPVRDLRAHLDLALTDPVYRFVLPEADELRHYWDLQPEHRDLLRRLLDQGRVEAVAGTGGSGETSIRHLVRDLGLHRHVLGARSPVDLAASAALFEDTDAGWRLDTAPTLAHAERVAYDLFLGRKDGAATKHVVLPIKTEAPSRWIPAIHHDWNSRYTWPRFISSLPRDYFTGVRNEGAQPGPVRDLSYVESRHEAEEILLDAEKFAVFANLLTGAGYPDAALTKAWDADQREAHDLARTVRDNALDALSSIVDTTGEGTVAVVWNPLTHDRSDMVTVRLAEPLPAGVRVLDDTGHELPVLVEHEGHSVNFRAVGVPSLGWRTFRLVAAEAGEQGWKQGGGTQIANSRYLLTVDPQRGGRVTSLVELAGERELIDEDAGEDEPVTVEVWHCAIGERVIVNGTRTITLWEGVDYPNDDRHQLLPVVVTPGEGRLPASGSLLSVQPATVTLAALKAAGNPLARNSAEPADPRSAIALRLVSGEPTTAVVTSPVLEFRDPATADLLEQRGDSLPGMEIPIDESGVVTVLAQPVIDEQPAGRPLGPSAEPAQPLSANYRGAVPLGGLPASVHLEVRGQRTLKVTAVSDRTDGDLHGSVRLVLPPGWTATPETMPFELAPGAHTCADVTLTAPETVVSGRYPVRAQLELTDEGLPVSWLQVVEDVVLLDVPEEDDYGLPVDALWIAEQPRPLQLAPGERGTLSIAVATGAHAAFAVEARLTSPPDIWDFTGPWAQGGEIPARGRLDFDFDVAVPPWAEAGRWLASITVAGAGLQRSSAAVLVEVRR